MNYTSYARALNTLKRTTLSSRRQQLNLKFAKKALKSEKFQHWFCAGMKKVGTAGTAGARQTRFGWTK
jgi:hypothetical protein